MWTRLSSMNVKRPLVILFLAGSLVSCSRNLERIAQLSQKLEQLEAEQEEISKELSEQRTKVQVLHGARDKLMEEMVTKSEELDTFVDRIGELQKGFVSYRNEYRKSIRARTKGLVLPDFSVGTKTYKGVSGSSVTSTELVFLHSDGMGKVALADAPANIQEIFAYDPAVPKENSKTAQSVEGFLDQIIKRGRERADEIAEAKNALQKSKIMTKATKGAGVPAGIPNGLQVPASRDWQRRSNFTGSYYAPLRDEDKNKKSGH